MRGHTVDFLPRRLGVCQEIDRGAAADAFATVPSESYQQHIRKSFVNKLADTKRELARWCSSA